MSVIVSHQLFYWDDRKDYENGAPALKGAIQLQGAIVEGYVETGGKGKEKEYVMVLTLAQTTKNKGVDKRIFKVGEVDLYNKWMTAFQRAAAGGGGEVKVSTSHRYMLYDHKRSHACCINVNIGSISLC